jgi:hypothetical protein
MKHKLAQMAMRYGGYKRTSDLMEKKWKLIADHLSADPEFSSSAITFDWRSLQIQFKRLQETVLKETGTDKPGANLSGLPEEPSPYQLLMMNMAEEVASGKGAKDIEKEKKRKLQSNLLTHESSALEQQVHIHYGSSVEPAPLQAASSQEEPSSLSSSSESVASKKVKREKKGVHYIEGLEMNFKDLTEEDPELTALQKQKLEREIKMMDVAREREESVTSMLKVMVTLISNGYLK